MLTRSVPPATIAVLILATVTGPTHAAAQIRGMAPREGSFAAARVHLRSDPIAVAAREVNLQETGHLHAIGEPGTTVIEHGSATGTYDSSIVVRLTIVSASRAIAAFTVKPKGGTVTGTGSARFKQQGANGYFGGMIAITRGTGSYARAWGTNIGISGVISRETFALTVHVHGTIHV